MHAGLVPDGRAAHDGAESLRMHFRRGKDGVLVLRAPRADDPRCRLDLADALLAATARNGKLQVDPALCALLRQESERWAPFVRGRRDPTAVRLNVVEGPPPARAAAYRATRRGFLVTNYEQVPRDLDVIQRWKADLIVLDEAQRIRNWAW